MISSRAFQPEGQYDNAAEYDHLFVARVHRLLFLGYCRLDSASFASDEETAITGELVEAIDQILDAPAEGWMRFFAIYDDPPVNEPARPGRPRRRGKHRQRVDIRLISAEVSPRARLLFECKRLSDAGSVKQYLGPDGLGRFLRGEYAPEDRRAGMLGYVQSEDEGTWAGRIQRQMQDSPADHAACEESPWRHEPVIEELEHTYRSGHGRSLGRERIEIYHTLLRCH